MRLLDFVVVLTVLLVTYLCIRFKLSGSSEDQEKEQYCQKDCAPEMADLKGTIRVLGLSDKALSPEFIKFVSLGGSVKSCSIDPTKREALVTYAEPSTANEAIQKLNKQNYNGQELEFKLPATGGKGGKGGGGFFGFFRGQDGQPGEDGPGGKGGEGGKGGGFH